MTPILLSLAISLADPPKPTIKPVFAMSRETTYITGPLTPDGYPDYEKYLNEKLRGKITPEQNACVLLWTALGPAPEGGQPQPAEYWEWLGTTEPPAGKSYFEDHYAFVKRRWVPQPPGAEFSDQMTRFEEQKTELRKKPWTKADAPEIAEWLDAQEPFLAIVAKAAERPAYFSPQVPRSKDGKPTSMLGVLLPHVQKYRGMADVLSLRAMRFLGDGKPDAAWRDIVTMIKLGRLAQRGSSLIEYLVGVAIEQISTNTAVEFIRLTNPTAAQVTAYRADLAKALPIDSTVTKVDLLERFIMLDAIVQIRKGGPSILEGLSDGEPVEGKEAIRSFEKMNWSKTFARATAAYDRMVKIGNEPTYLTRKAAWEKFEAELKAMKSEVVENKAKIDEAIRDGKLDDFLGDAIGKILVSLLTPAIQKVGEAEVRCRQGADNLAIAFAIAAFRADTKRLPKTLAELSPTYLKAIPTDRYTDKAMHYELTEDGYFLAAVGLNGELDRKLIADPVAEGEKRGDDVGIRMKVAN